MIKTYSFAMTAAMLFLSDTAMARMPDSQRNPLERPRGMRRLPVELGNVAPVPRRVRLTPEYVLNIMARVSGEAPEIRNIPAEHSVPAPRRVRLTPEYVLNVIARVNGEAPLSHERQRELRSAMPRASGRHE